MGDLFKALTEASLDNLFIVVGLGFLAVAILGDISGKIRPGTFGRIASAVLGIGLMAAGLWMHSESRLAIRSLEIRASNKVYRARCPVRVELTGIIEAEGSGTVVYSFAFSDGTETVPSEIRFDKSDTRTVSGIWEVQKSISNAEARLKILAPEEKQTMSPEIISVTCEETAPQAGIPSPPAPAVVVIPVLEGHPISEAEQELSNLGLNVGTVSAIETRDQPVGAVVETTPASGSKVLKGSKVDLTIANTSIHVNALMDQFVGTWRNIGHNPDELQTVQIKEIDAQTAQVALTGSRGSWGGAQFHLSGAELVFSVDKFGGMTQALYRNGDKLIMDQRFKDLPANLRNRPDLAPRIVLERVQ